MRGVISFLLVALIVANIALAQTGSPENTCTSVDTSVYKFDCGSCTKYETVINGTSSGFFCKACSSGMTLANTVVAAEVNGTKTTLNLGAKCTQANAASNQKSSGQVVALAVTLMGLVAALLN